MINYVYKSLVNMINSVSILIPCFNEEKTIKKVIDKVLNIDLGNISREIIIINDGSTDQTKTLLESYEDIKNVKLIHHDRNYGKGKALRSGIKNALNDIIIIQDADLEYDPDQYHNLLKPFIETEADIVYGSRFLGGGDYNRLLFFWHSIANKILTLICNFFSNLNMTDMETGFKVFKREVLQSIDLKENSFGIEPEITIKLAKKKFIFFEVPIKYNGRGYEEGKKIGIKDAFRALYCIIKYSFFD